MGITTECYLFGWYECSSCRQMSFCIRRNGNLECYDCILLNCVKESIENGNILQTRQTC